MNPRTTLIMLGIACVLGAVALVVMLRNPGARPLSGDPNAGSGLRGGELIGRALAEVSLGRPLDPAEVAQITLIRSIPARAGAKETDSERLVFERTSARPQPTWRMTEPSTAAGNRFAIEGFLARAAGLAIVEVISEDELVGDLSPSDLRLDEPAVRARLTLETGEELHLDLGRRSVAGRAFTRLGGAGPVYVVDDALHRRLEESDPVAWRDPALFGPEAQEASRVRIRVLSTANEATAPARPTAGPGAPIPADATTAGSEDEASSSVAIARILGAWRLLEPVRTHVDPVARAKWLNALSIAQAQGFLSDRRRESLDVYGLDPASEPTELTLEFDRPQADGSVARSAVSLRIGRPLDLSGQLRYAMRSDIANASIMTVNADTLASILPPGVSLIGRSVLPVQSPEVRWIEFSPTASTAVAPEGSDDLPSNAGLTSWRIRRGVNGWERVATEAAANPLDAGGDDPLAADVMTTPVPDAVVSALLSLLTQPLPGATYLTDSTALAAGTPRNPGAGTEAPSSMASRLVEHLGVLRVEHLGTLRAGAFTEIELPAGIEVFAATAPLAQPAGGDPEAPAAAEATATFPVLVSDGGVVRFDPHRPLPSLTLTPVASASEGSAGDAQAGADDGDVK